MFIVSRPNCIWTNQNPLVFMKRPLEALGHKNTTVTALQLHFCNFCSSQTPPDDKRSITAPARGYFYDLKRMRPVLLLLPEATQHPSALVNGRWQGGEAYEGEKKTDLLKSYSRLLSGNCFTPDKKKDGHGNEN